MSGAPRTTTVILMGVVASLASASSQVSSTSGGPITEVKAIEQSIQNATLDQPGTHPFHLVAEFKPSYERDKATHREGRIEIWWQSPTTWRKEFHSGALTQTVVSNEAKAVQQVSDGYFPSWARELEAAIIQPFPGDFDVLEQNLSSMDVRRFQYNLKSASVDQADILWTLSEPANTLQGRRQIWLTFTNGRLSFSMGTGWSGMYSDFQDFHHRSVARTVKSGDSPELTARVTLLEDLKNPPQLLFDGGQLRGSSPLVKTVALGEGALRQNLLASSDHFNWPTVANGPFDGVVWATLTVDATGAVRDVGEPISDNPALKDGAAQGFAGLKFEPFKRDGQPVQVTARISERFHTSRPAGMEVLGSARDYFNKARAATFAEQRGFPNRLQANFQLSTPHGIVRGTYTATWVNANNWLRQAALGSSQVTLGRKNGERVFVHFGPDQEELNLVVASLNPLPDDDTLTESDYRIRRVTLNENTAIRVTRALEDANGALYPTNNLTYWFDDAGHLLQCITDNMQYEGLDYVIFHGAKTPWRIRLLKDQSVVLEAEVSSIEDVTGPIQGP